MVTWIMPAFVSVSIHTPIQGVTRCPYNPTSGHPVSIHTPIQGVTFKWFYDYNKGLMVSIHTPIQGVTGWIQIFWMTNWFQSTHPYRV